MHLWTLGFGTSESVLTDPCPLILKLGIRSQHGWVIVFIISLHTNSRWSWLTSRGRRVEYPLGHCSLAVLQTCAKLLALTAALSCACSPPYLENKLYRHQSYAKQSSCMHQDATQLTKIAGPELDCSLRERYHMPTRVWILAICEAVGLNLEIQLPVWRGKRCHGVGCWM